ncbi:DUF6177 family protein [Microbacterium sp. M3]|uniref:DUF6177 family protein n=1 Tax=Microbacterium arthrosphaerae TaxID=792652 RepID=A0ABU4H2F8_9MICO|nr:MULTISPECIES: DUF6177 family protein [Microbacterium]MDW4573518.1 DUF6177 family protein [Microbacterium arthrosphaerae]MDW7607373.1 DUF6177 family protein [Microbacterium sp. M3]
MKKTEITRDNDLMTTSPPDSLHPFLDEVGALYGAIAPQASLIAATEWLQGAMRDVAATGRRPVLLTPDTARLTFAARRTLDVLGGVWVVHSPAGLLRDGVTGRRYVELADAFAPVAPGEVADPSHLREDAGARHPRLVIELSTAHRARAETVLGRSAELLTDALVGTDVLGWGTAEPAALHWNRENLTAYVRSRMPEPTRLVYSAHPAAHTSGTLVVTRTSSGVTENFTQVVGLPGGREAFADAVERAVDGFTRVAEEQQPLVGVVSGTWGRLDGSTPALLQPPTAPLVLLIGPRAVRDLRIDIRAVTERFGARSVGRPRIPALVVPLAADGRSGWDAFLELGSTLRAEDLERAFGVAGTEAARAS